MSKKYVDLVEAALSLKGRKKAEWMAKMSDAAEKLNKDVVGKIDWDSATHLFNTGKTPEEAAKSIAKIGPQENQWSKKQFEK